MGRVNGLGEDRSDIVGGVFDKLCDVVLCLLDGLCRSSAREYDDSTNLYIHVYIRSIRRTPTINKV